jgi:hypothetical protein
MLIGRLPLLCMALGLVNDAEMRRDSAAMIRAVVVVRV